MHDLVRIFRCPLWIIPMLLGVADSSSAQSPNAPPPNNQPSSAQPSRAKGSTPLAFYGEGYVLLQHGNVLHGFVKPHADRVTITLDKGNEVTVPNRQVLTIGKSVESLYSFQVRAIRRWGTGEHWHLAHWCIQNGLLDEAIEHYNELEKTVKDSPKFKQLDLQLRQALLADAQVQQALQAQGIPNPIAPASYDQHAEGSENSAAVARREEDPEPEPLSPFVPGYLRRSFQIDVLPIVVSRCGQAGCHGMLSKNDFQVFQPVGEQAASISQRNLDSLMAYVDHSDPAQTSLVQYAVRPHGAQRNPSIQTNREEDRALMDKLVHWLRSVKDAENGTHSSHVIPGSSPNSQKTEKSSVAPAMALIPKSAVQQQIRRRSSGDVPQQDRNAKLSKPPKSAPAPVVLNALELSEIEDAIAQLEQKHQEKPSSRDPFDPAVFNAKFATEKPPSK